MLKSEWGFYALSASKAIFRARTYNCITYSALCIFHCIFCGNPDTFDHRKTLKGHKLIKVQTHELHGEIDKLCHTRADTWAEKVKGRRNNIHDLFAADAVYHQVCSVNFRTNKSIPRQFITTEEHSHTKRGRPKDSVQMEAFLKVAAYLEENDDEQTTINDLIEKMKEYLGESDHAPYQFTYMKDQIKQHFGNKIVITEINGKTNVVTFRSTASAILHDFYCQTKQDDSGADKMRIIETAAKLIKSDIQSVIQTKDSYASFHELSSVDEAISFLPESQQLMLRVLFPSQSAQVKLASLGQSIMQATRPRILLAPLQVGLGVQLHHHFASKFLIDSLNKHGFCCSYSEVLKFSRNAAVTQGTDIPGFSPGHFVQYVADNVDHNVRTIDGMNTFHGMGMIAATTPATKNNARIPRISVSAEDIATIGTVNIAPFMPELNGMQAMFYENLSDVRNEDPTSILDDLWQLSLSVRSPIPAWSGMMQMVHTGEYPEQSSVLFLPMIDMDPSNMSCVHSTLQFICQHASRHGITPIITFDQPLWWKSLQVIESQPENSPLHSIVLRLGGFHTQMSFVGCIGHIMAGSGLQELLELIYANNTVTHMLNGKAIQRVVRGLFLVDSALSATIISEEFNVKPPCIALQNNVENEADVVGENPNVLTQHEIPEPEQTPTNQATDAGLADLEAIGNLHDELLAGKKTVHETCGSEEFIRVVERLDTKKRTMQESRTASLISKFRKSKFSINLDECSSNANQRILSVLIQYYSEDEKKVVVKHYFSDELIFVNAQSVYGCVVSHFERDGIPMSNIISSLSDSAGYMRGSKSGFETRLKPKAPNMVNIGGGQLSRYP